MPISAIAAFVFGTLVIGLLFLAGIVGFTPHNYQPCVIKQNDTTSSSVVYTFGFLQLKEPVFVESCFQGLRQEPGRSYDVNGQTIVVPAK